jgi:hypothetical protein
MIVVDGEFKNARVYYLESPEYRARYAPGTSHEQRKVLEDGFEAKVADLIAKHGVLNSATVDAKGNLVVPGIERNAESIRAMRNLTQELSEKATGGMSDDEIRGYQQSIYTKSMMIYKNWIPSLASMRYAKLQYSDRTQSYEWGRMRTFYSILAQDHIKAINTFLQVAKCTDEGLRRMDVMYLKKKADHLKDTGKELEITKEEFYDLMRNNVRTAAKDVILTSTLLIMWLLAKQLPPDDDEDPMVKSWYNFMMKAIDKVLDEMLFFYSPKSADGMLNGNIFPTFSVLTDSLKLMGAFGAEIFGLIFKDDKWVDDNKVIKYVMKSFPVTSQISTWIPLFAPEAAKDMGLRISPEARPRH